MHAHAGGGLTLPADREDHGVEYGDHGQNGEAVRSRRTCRIETGCREYIDTETRTEINEAGRAKLEGSFDNPFDLNAKSDGDAPN